jgi:hypothetical protein
MRELENTIVRIRLIHSGYNSSETSFSHDLTRLLQSW